MRFVNLTPHTIVIVCEGENIVLEPSGIVARSTVKAEKIGMIDGIPIFRNVYGAVEGLPDSVDGTIYIVSALTAQAVPERSDVFITNDPVRDDQGRIIGCRSLAHI